MLHVCKRVLASASPPGRRGSDLLRMLFGGLLFVGIAAVVLKLRVPRPFVSIWLTAVFLSVLGAVRAESKWARRLSLASLGLGLSLGLSEGVWAVIDKLSSGDAAMTGTSTEPGYIVEGGELGYAPTPGTQVSARKMLGKQLVYDGCTPFPTKACGSRRVIRAVTPGYSWDAR